MTDGERSQAQLSPLFTWRSAVASEHGPDSSTTRLVLLTLSLHMNERGGSCFPSTRKLAVESGLSRRSVESHLRAAAESGWIRRSDPTREPDGTFRPVEYTATVPGERPSPGPGERGSHGPGETRSSPGEPHDNDQGKEVPHRTSVQRGRQLEDVHTSEIQRDLLEGGSGNGSDPLEEIVDEVWERTLAAWKGRVGNQPGPNLQRTEKRERKIRARAREVVEAGGNARQAVLYLSTAARGFYADDWERRDEFLDPAKYLFRDEETVRRYYRRGRRGDLGLSQADERLANRVAELMEEGV